MLLLVALIFRAVAIEFRSKQPMRWWRQMWDIGFSVGSIVSALLIGVALGNIAWGVPIDANGEFAGTFLGLLTPYPLLRRRHDRGAVHDARRDLRRDENRGRAARQTARLGDELHHLLRDLRRDR